MTYDNGIYVAVGAGTGYSQGRIMTSTDRVNWTERVAVEPDVFTSVAHSQNVYVAVGKSGKIYTSSNAQSWSARTSGTTSDLWKVRYLNNRFIAVGDSGVVLLSDDGIVWRKSTLPSDINWKPIGGVAYGDGKYVIVSRHTTSNGTMAYSQDGVNWISVNDTQAGSALYDITYVNNQFIAVGDKSLDLNLGKGTELDATRCD